MSKPITRFALAVLLLVGGRAAPAEGQDDDGLRVVLSAGASWQGTRYEGSPPASDVVVELSPTNGAYFGLALGARIRPRLRWSVEAGYAKVNYENLLHSPGGDPVRNLAGDQHFTRLLAGLQFRMTPRAPGFFAAGLAATHVRPTSNPFITGDESSRIEFGGYGGIGLDLGGGARALRVEARYLVMKPNADPLAGMFSPLESKSFTGDFTLAVGIVLGGGSRQ